MYFLSSGVKGLKCWKIVLFSLYSDSNYVFFHFLFLWCIAIMIAVFLVEKTGRLLTLEAGRNTTAGIINKLMAENLSLNPESAKAFCLWLTSPLLRE